MPETPASARLRAFRPYLPRLFRPRLHVGLVDLNDVGARGKEILDFRVDGGRVVDGRFLVRPVELVLRLLSHRERPRYGDLDLPCRVRPEKPHIADGDRVPAPDLSDDPRNGIGMAGSVERRAGIVDIDAIERGRKPVGVALAANFTVGDNVEPGILLSADRQQRGIVLRFSEKRLRHAP